MTEEAWKPVVGFEGYYEISSEGRVRSLKSQHIRQLSPRLNKRTGYLFLILSANGKHRTVTIHRLVAEAFLEKPDGFDYVNHKDEVKTNNNVENLEWCTPAYNNDYSKYQRYKPIELFSIDGELLATFTSKRAVSEVLGVSKAMVTNATKGVSDSCAGFLLVEKEKEVR